MKQILLLACLSISLYASSQRRIALIVAIGEYPSNSGWGNLSSINDIKYVKAGLMKHGFSDGDISLLLNQQATKAGIIKALDDLYNRVQLNDIVVFHFSGHGQQIFDDNKDELDGYDEALIPYDAAARYDPVTYKGENHLRDDLLGEKLKRIREKIGPKGSLIVLVDACHSGTSTRGADVFVARGTPIPFSKPGYKPNISTTLGGGEEKDFIGSGMGNFVVISASNPHQVNFETKDADNQGVGSLSYAFARALGELQKGTSYEMLFRKIKALIQAQFPQQIPMIEGSVQLEVFGGNMIPQESYIGIEKWLNDTSMLINVGFLNNVSKGAKFTLYALNDKNETMPVAEGYIALAGTFQSHGIISKAIPRGEVYKVKIEETGFGDLAASVSFKASDDKGVSQAALMDQKGSSQSRLIAQIKNFVQPYQYLSISSNPDYLFDIRTTKSGGLNIQLVDKSDSTRWNVSVKKGDTLTEVALKQMLDNLKKAMRINYLRNMPDGGAMTQNVIVEITPLSGPATTDDLWMKEGEKFRIRIANNNAYKLYFNLVDITPDNAVKVLIPNSDNGETVEEFVIQPQSEFVIDELVVDAGTPSGREFMKFIFTKTAMDLRPVLARSGTRGPANRSGVENVINDMFKDGGDFMSTRSSIPSKVKVDEVGVVTRSFSIKK
jgi:hypothetical protein